MVTAREEMVAEQQPGAAGFAGGAVVMAPRWLCEDLEEKLPFTERGPPRAEGNEEVALDAVPLRCLSTCAWALSSEVRMAMWLEWNLRRHHM